MLHPKCCLSITSSALEWFGDWFIPGHWLSHGSSANRFSDVFIFLFVKTPSVLVLLLLLYLSKFPLVHEQYYDVEENNEQDHQYNINGLLIIIVFDWFGLIIFPEVGHNIKFKSSTCGWSKRYECNLRISWFEFILYFFVIIIDLLTNFQLVKIGSIVIILNRFCPYVVQSQFGWQDVIVPNIPVLMHRHFYGFQFFDDQVHIISRIWIIRHLDSVTTQITCC